MARGTVGKLNWYKRNPDAALAGMAGLTLEQRGAYNFVLDLMYARAGRPVPDDDAWLARGAGSDIRVWRRVKADLIRHDKLKSVDGFLFNSRVEIEVQDGLTRLGSNGQVDHKSGISSPEVRQTFAKSSPNLSPKSPPVSANNSDLGKQPSRARAQHSESDKEERKKESANSDPSGPLGNGSSIDHPLALVRPPNGDWSIALFRQGLAWLGKTVDQSPDKLRPLVGKWLKLAGGDHKKIFDLMAIAERNAIADPRGWISAHLGVKNNGPSPNRGAAAWVEWAANVGTTGTDPDPFPE